MPGLKSLLLEDSWEGRSQLEELRGQAAEDRGGSWALQNTRATCALALVLGPPVEA